MFVGWGPGGEGRGERGFSGVFVTIWREGVGGGWIDRCNASLTKSYSVLFSSVLFSLSLSSPRVARFSRSRLTSFFSLGQSIPQTRLKFEKRLVGRDKEADGPDEWEDWVGEWPEEMDTAVGVGREGREGDREGGGGGKRREKGKRKKVGE